MVAEWTKIRVSKLAETEAQKLRKLEDTRSRVGTLHKRVIAQDEAVAAVARAVPQGPGRLKGSETAHWLLFVPGSHRSGKDGAF